MSEDVKPDKNGYFVMPKRLGITAICAIVAAFSGAAWALAGLPERMTTLEEEQAAMKVQADEDSKTVERMRGFLCVQCLDTFSRAECLKLICIPAEVKP